MTPRERHFMGLATEKSYGYCRAIKADGRVWVSGTTALAAAGGVLPEHRGDAYAQSREAFSRIAAALAHFGLGIGHVVAIRAYMTRPEAMSGFLKAHAEVLGPVQPASTMVGTPFLIHADLLVEIEAEAVA
jgi:enamine deaminase RidA (YjgF/YER057c/UK114 family)